MPVPRSKTGARARADVDAGDFTKAIGAVIGARNGGEIACCGESRGVWVGAVGEVGLIQSIGGDSWCDGADGDVINDLEGQSDAGA